MKFVLGTVQFGIEYGIANKFGKLKINEIQKIINLAKQKNIKSLDTANSYGNAEEILGNIGVNDFNIATKLVPGLNIKNDKKVLIEEIDNSLNKMAIKEIDTIYFHRTEDLLSKNGNLIYETLTELKQKKIIKNIGISIYSTNELELILDKNKIEIDIVQAPYNLVDRRIEYTGWLKELNKRSIFFYARSIFLQGILLMKYNQMPNYFKKWDHIWKEWYEWLKDNPNISPLEACIGFVYNNNLINKVIVGVDSCNQLQEIINSVNHTSNTDYPDMNSGDESLILPFNWPK